MEFYGAHYKRLLIIPLVLTIICAFFATQIESGIDFKGGTQITAPVSSDVNVIQLKQDLESQFQLVDLSIRKTTGFQTGIYIQYLGAKELLSIQSLIDNNDFKGAIAASQKITGITNATGSEQDQASVYQTRASETFKNNLSAYISSELNIPAGSLSINEVGASLGVFFWGQAQNAIIIGFVLVSILIFFYFRKVIISFAVIQAAFFDVLCGLAVMGVLKIPLSLATIPPLLMLIGYSVDTDIMLTDRVIKRKEGTPREKVHGALATGLTMTGTTLGALVGLFIVSSLANIEILSQISIILIGGLVGDLVSTWITNVVLVLWVVEKGSKNEHA